MIWRDRSQQPYSDKVSLEGVLFVDMCIGARCKQQFGQVHGDGQHE